ncbi:MAG: tetratricopeptide repeat protein [Parachlamydiaceae bacterium]
MQVRYVDHKPANTQLVPIPKMSPRVFKGGRLYALLGSQEKKYNRIHRVGLALLAFIKTIPLGIGLLFKSTREDWKAVFTGKKLIVFYGDLHKERLRLREALPKTDKVVDLKALAEQGDAEAQFELGIVYYDNQFYEEAASWFHKAAESNHASALVKLGYMYKYRLGVAEDAQKSFEYLQQAADLGLAEAQYQLGRIYSTGLDENYLSPHPFSRSAMAVEQDLEKAFEYYQLAANQGYRSATRRIAECYRYGCGVEQDEQQAIKYDQLAAEQEGPGAHEGAWLAVIQRWLEEIESS